MWFLWALWYMVTWKRVEVVVVFCGGVVRFDGQGGEDVGRTGAER